MDSAIDKATMSDLIGAIYDCAIDPERWPDTLDRLRHAFDLPMAMIGLDRVPTMQKLIAHTSGLSEADEARMLALAPHVPEIWGGFAASAARPIDAPWVLSRITPPEALARMSYTREWAAPKGLVDSAAIVLARNERLVGSIGLATDARRGIISDALLHDLALLVPHLQRAAQISDMLDARAEAAYRFETLVEALVAPVITVGPGLEMIHANASARSLLDAAALLGLRHGQITSDVPGVRQALLRIVARLGEGDALTPGSGIGLPVRARDGAVHTLHVMPLSHGDLRPRLMPGAAAAIFVSSAANPHNLVRDVLQSLFGLTPAEVRVFEQISAGATTHAAADAMGIARSTLRTHLLRVFAKTGVNRQADLIRMAAALSTPAGMAS